MVVWGDNGLTDDVLRGSTTGGGKITRGGARDGENRGRKPLAVCPKEP